MKDRIFSIMKKENMNQKEFSQATGIAPATLSSIFNGRTSPTLNHAEALHHRFPELNMSWLLFGEGDMQVPIAAADPLEDTNAVAESDGEGVTFFSPETSFDFTGQSTNSSPLPASGVQRTHLSGEPVQQVIRETVKYIDKPERKISEIRIFFDDGTYEVFPGQK